MNKGSDGLKFAVAVIVALVTLYGFVGGFSIFGCNLLFEQKGTGPAFDLVCGMSENFATYPHYETDISRGFSFIMGAIVIDGIVLGAYQFFGKPKENREPVEKNT